MDHEEKKIYLYQVTGDDLKDHPFAMHTINTFMTKLSLFEVKNVEYKLILLCFCDWNRKISHGTKFFDTNMNRNIVFLNQLRSQKNQLAVRLDVFIIRACLLSSKAKSILK